MANKNFNTRIQLKSDTEANWDKATNFIPLKGEAIIYSADSAHPFSRLKVGDGVTVVSELPFVGNEDSQTNLFVNMTMAEYEALSQEEKMDDTIRFITDANLYPAYSEANDIEY